MLRRIAILLLAVALMFCSVIAVAAEKTITVNTADYPVEKDGSYSTMEEVAVYLHTYGKLPENFLKKKEAEALGWQNRLGNLGKVAPGCSIGGDYFGNYEGIVPSASGRKWTECDINFDGGYRNGERIVFSNDGLIYYSNDHYTSFTQIIVEEGENLPQAAQISVTKKGKYTSKDEVAAYIHQFGKLPSNYISRDEAKALGWTNKKDNLGEVAPGRTIGGDSFQNKEKILPAAEGRVWHECDVERSDGRRSEKRIVYSNDGLIYYTPDNHKTFTRLY